MVAKKENQKSGIGQELLHELILKCKSIGLKRIELSARETVLGFYSKSGFKTLGNRYASTKTEVIHHKMFMNINNIG